VKKNCPAGLEDVTVSTVDKFQGTPSLLSFPSEVLQTRWKIKQVQDLSRSQLKAGCESDGGRDGV